MKEGSVILLTGASRGIGAAAAKHLQQRGYKVYGTSRKPGDPPTPGVEMLQLDVADDASAVRCVSDVIEREGRLDVLVNNAGYAHVGALEDVTLDEMRTQFDTNLYGVHRMTQATLPQMHKQGGGRIVNISSAIGRVSMPYMATYCASKFALEGYSEGMAKELEPHGIQVVIMEPGLTASEFHDNLGVAASISERYRPAMEQMQQRIPEMRKHADSVDAVAEVIVQCVEDEKPRLRYLAPAAKALLSGN